MSWQRTVKMALFSSVAGLAALGALMPVARAADAATPAALLIKTATLERTTYNGWDAYRLTDGKTEAVVVPQLGRVMRYGFVGDPNVLWNATDKPLKIGTWNNYGGDKTWPAPQSIWGWPPHSSWDGGPHQVRILPDGVLSTISEVWPDLGVRVTREYGFAENGDFVIAQTVDKEQGELQFLSIWSVTQIPVPDAVFVPLNPQSVYKDNFHWIESAPNTAWKQLSPTLLRLGFNPAKTYKIGADAPVSAIAAVKDGVAIVEKTAHPGGDYPDGALGHGFPVEVFNGGQGLGYMELELLSPLRRFRTGGRWRHTVRWSLHKLPSASADDPAVTKFMDGLLQGP